MDLSVTEDNVHQVVRDLRMLIKDCLLPRIDRLENEVRELREFSWPVCSGISGGGRDLIRIDDDMENMVRKKCEVIRKLFPDESWRYGRSQDELEKILQLINKDA